MNGTIKIGGMKVRLRNTYLKIKSKIVLLMPKLSLILTYFTVPNTLKFAKLIYGCPNKVE